jgi:hypothetical protein
MSNKQLYIDIEDCVYAFLDETEQNKSSRFYRCWQLAYRAASELGLDIFYAIKTVRLTVNANQTVTLPDDCVQFCKIGELDATGQVCSFIVNESLVPSGAYPNRVIPNTQATYMNEYYDPASPVFYNYWDGFSYHNIYGEAVVRSSFKVDEESGVIILHNQSNAGEVVLEYKAAPEEGSPVRIPRQFKEAVISYIAWKDIRYIPSSRRGSGNDKEQRRRDYYNERRLAKSRYRPFYLEEARNFSRGYVPSII